MGYFVTYQASGYRLQEGSVMPVDSTEYASGATVTAATPSGYIIGEGPGGPYVTYRWKTDPGDILVAFGEEFIITSDIVLVPDWIEATNVTYDGNDALSGDPPAVKSLLAGGSINASGNTGSLTKAPYTFTGWNTAADGSGTHYDVDESFVVAESITLYADWVEYFTVTYDGNGSTGGTAPVDGNSYASGSTVTVLGNTGSLTRTQHAFDGWNTQADGLGDSYDPGATFEIGANTTLYAVWADLMQVTYDANGAVVGLAPTDSSTYLEGVEVTVLDNTHNLRKIGYEFSEWNTLADGSGTGYVADETFTMGAADVTLYAIFVNPFAAGVEAPIASVRGTMFTPTKVCSKCRLPFKETDVISFRGKNYGVPCGCSGDIVKLARGGL